MFNSLWKNWRRDSWGRDYPSRKFFNCNVHDYYPTIYINPSRVIHRHRQASKHRIHIQSLNFHIQKVDSLNQCFMIHQMWIYAYCYRAKLIDINVALVRSGGPKKWDKTLYCSYEAYLKQTIMNHMPCCSTSKHWKLSCLKPTSRSK